MWDRRGIAYCENEPARILPVCGGTIRSFPRNGFE